MRIISIMLLFLSVSVSAKDVKINTPQTTPVVGETFSVEFIVKTKDSTEPEINFEPLGVEVVSKSPGSYTSRTTFINGKYSSESTMRYSYELIADKIGFAYLRNIVVVIGGKKVRHPSVKFNVLREAKKASDIFAKVHLSKDTAYVGESVLIRYYLYNKSTTPVNSTDIKKFPKLNKLLKRYHQEKTSGERVRVNGEVYTRRIIYTAQVFAENAGEYKIDPISFRVSYSKNNNAYNNFGFGLRLGSQKVKSVRSKSTQLNIINLPMEGVPEGFAGLVGKHNFELKINKNKFIVNEPVEIKLEVSGPGALELYDPPSILLNDNLEEFEKNVDLNIQSDFTAKKKIDYTYLGRDGVKLEGTVIPMSYFDPELKKYVTKGLTINPIVIAGVGTKATINKDTKDRSLKNNEKSKAVEVSARFLPIYKTMSTFVYNSSVIFKYLLSFLIFCILYIAYRFMAKREVKEETLVKEILSNGVTYSTWHKLLTQNNEQKSISQIIIEQKFPPKTERYFLDLNEKLNSAFKQGDSSAKIKVKKKEFKDLDKRINAGL